MSMFGVSKGGARMFRVGESRATFNDINAVLLNVQCQITRNLQPLPTLTEGIIWVSQPVQGQLTANSIIASNSSITTLANSACKMITGTVKFTGSECYNGSEKNKNVTLTIDDGYCSGFTISCNAQNAYIGSDVSIMFTKCNVSV